MNAAQRYLREMVEPAFLDFQRNPKSARHAAQTCVAVYHAIDRFTHPKRPSNLRDDWSKREDIGGMFRIVDMVAHKYKHGVSDGEKEPVDAGKLTLSGLVFGKELGGTSGFNATDLGEEGIDLYNLQFVIRDVIRFLRQEALKLPDATPDGGRRSSSHGHDA
jgi:hypothetical protein